MIKTTRQYFCDACGKDMTEDRYSMGTSILHFDNDGEAETIGLDFCEECARSFAEWRRSRKNTEKRDDEKTDEFGEEDLEFVGIDVSYPGFCTYKEYEGKPYFGIKYKHNGELYVGFGTYTPEILSGYIKNNFIIGKEKQK